MFCLGIRRQRSSIFRGTMFVTHRLGLFCRPHNFLDSKILIGWQNEAVTNIIPRPSALLPPPCMTPSASETPRGSVRCSTSSETSFLWWVALVKQSIAGQLSIYQLAFIIVYATFYSFCQLKFISLRLNNIMMEQRRREACDEVDEIRIAGGGIIPDDLEYLERERPRLLRSVRNLQT